MVTLKEIAKAVGVSTATVSRVLNFDQTLSVTAQKRQAIIETAEALNYATPRARNRANAQGLNKVALVHFLRPEQELIDPYYVGLRLGIESRCQALKIETVKVYHTDLQCRSRPCCRAPRASSPSATTRDEEIAWLKKHSRHVVFADFIPPTDEFDSVVSDLALAMHKLLNALKEQGLSPHRLRRLDRTRAATTPSAKALPHLHRVVQGQRRVRSAHLRHRAGRRAQHRADRLSASRCG